MPRYAYEEVAETIRKRIYDGTYPPGSMLPPRSVLRAEFDRSDQVIGWAMRILHGQGLIETLHGVGVRVVSTLPKQQ